MQRISLAVRKITIAQIRYNAIMVAPDRSEAAPYSHSETSLFA